MISSYFKIAFRSFRRGHIYSLINLFGLAIGLASVMLIIAYVGYELSFDKHFSNSNRIYQLVMKSGQNDLIQQTVQVPEPLGKTLIQEFPEVEASTLLSPGESTFLIGDKPIDLKTLLVNPDFFEIFDLPIIKGNKAAALSDKSGIVITADAADKLFPDVEAMGKTISRKSWNGKLSYFTVTGVIKNIPAQTHFTTDVILSTPVSSETLNFQAYSSRPQYVMLRDHADPDKLRHKVSGILSKYNLHKNSSIQFLPLADIHLRSGKIENSNFNINDIRYVYIFGCIAFLILLIGCINYVNLTTAQALQRVKEVGIRKTLGSSRGQLAFQFIGESFLFFSMAIILAVFISLLVWPTFSNFLHIQLPFSYLYNFQNVAVFLAVALMAGAFSGMYPALFISRLQPAGVLKDSQGRLKINLSLRKLLIVFQFTISIILIIATIVVWQQLSLFNNRPLGFQKDQLLILPVINMDGFQNGFKRSLLENPNILAVSIATLELGNGIGNSSKMPDPSDSTHALDFAFVYGDFDFIKTMGIKLKEGRNFSDKWASDILNYDSLSSVANEIDAREIRYQSPIIITESLSKKLELKNPADKVLKLSALKGRVIGVVKDFQVTTLKQQSPFLVYQLKTNGYAASTYIRLHTQNTSQSISYIEKIWKEYFPNQTFNYAFADDNLQKLYESENRLATIFSSFALLAIGISALGLFSLVALIVKQRTKEIGIRKVMGASVSGITILLSKDFVKLILIALVIASPAAWYGMNMWLQDFANRVEVEWWMFLVAASIALFIGIVTVTLQTSTAAKMNPVDSLKIE